MNMSDKEKIRAVIIGLQETGNPAHAQDVWDLLDGYIALEGRLTQEQPALTDQIRFPAQRTSPENFND